ncbi:DUF2927 domain-containing protein [Methanolapillus millepedarum]|uniref:Uncharacterized protein n=1 Tax=Methanolapillus millepedarum TaxID=3028296 RepID=A0AA96V592_9EURY|nr:hypothetical protein MsAc7_13770 [Methanosarcinaceae archaeon Ac7]
MKENNNSETGGSTPQKQTAAQTIKGIVILVVVFAVIAVVLSQSGAFAIINPGWGFKVLNEKSSEDFDEALVFIYDTHFTKPSVSGVQKWATPIKIKVEGNPSEKDLNALNEIIAAFNTVDGFPGMQIVNSGENVKIIFTTNENYEQIRNMYTGDSFDKSFCDFNVRNGEIYQANIIMEPGGPQGYRNSVQLHEFSHMIGFYNHVDGKTSIMNYNNPVSGMSKTDTLAFKMLYNPEIPIGMPYFRMVDYYDSMTVDEFLNQ